ncbi:hypothetical protein [Sorangium sp. So ce131]|uniref:hypothetical protein n=1 Tax=Sorangium sp. So ce131 TaxID=3133282 RepID=UPI003F61D1DE
MLRPGGALLLADSVPPGGAPGRMFARVLRRFEHLADNLADRLPAVLTGAGSAEVAEIDRHPTVLLPLAFLRGYKPGIS